ncbi:MAG TPA: DUF2510 domain-containing protein [Acidimicrobiales bacterium]|nr:DUF2510 domain-containing protein [Acidimicrobiales bacterium]
MEDVLAPETPVQETPAALQAPQAPAAWYPNPENPAELRWWDGKQWTAHTHPIAQRKPAGVRVLDPQPAAASPAVNAVADERKARLLAVARGLGLVCADLENFPINIGAVALLPERLARRHHVLAVGWKFNAPVIAMEAPDNVNALDDIRLCLGRRDFHIVVAYAWQIDEFIDRLYPQVAG